MADLLRYLLRRTRRQSSGWNEDGEEEEQVQVPKFSEEEREALRARQSEALKASDLGQRITVDSGRLQQGSKQLPWNIHQILQARQCNDLPFGGFDKFAKARASARFMPVNYSRKLTQFRSRVFCGMYSQDGEEFMCATQEGQITVQEGVTSRTPSSIRQYDVHDLGWAIIDAAFSPDKKSIIYSTWSNYVHMINIETHQSKALDFRHPHLCPFSVVFSQNNKEIIAGSNQRSVLIYDLELDRLVLTGRAHSDDVNAVAFADDSSHVFFSGSDDRTIKVWDRRMFTDARPNAVGSFVGHFQGITHIDSKRDGVHLISQSKDCSIKLWDIRKMASPTASATEADEYFDYRSVSPNQRIIFRRPHADDTSLMTYLGHNVARTLIRARFSPVHSTGQQYIVSGCASGNVLIYNTLTGRCEYTLKGHTDVSRDVSWHPFEPSILSSSWDGTVMEWTHSPHVDDEEDDNLASDDGSWSDDETVA